MIVLQYRQVAVVDSVEFGRSSVCSSIVIALARCFGADPHLKVEFYMFKLYFCEDMPSMQMGFYDKRTIQKYGQP
jgi:hypothetical protein